MNDNSGGKNMKLMSNNPYKGNNFFALTNNKIINPRQYPYFNNQSYIGI
jgi:hypothetical protein